MVMIRTKTNVKEELQNPNDVRMEFLPRTIEEARTIKYSGTAYREGHCFHTMQDDGIFKEYYQCPNRATRPYSKGGRALRDKLLCKRHSNLFDVHHKDGNHRNNDLDNLKPCYRTDHRTVHGNDRKFTPEQHYVRALFSTLASYRKPLQSVKSRIEACESGIHKLPKNVYVELKRERDRLNDKTNTLEKKIKEGIRFIPQTEADHEFVEAMFKISGVGPSTVAAIIIFFDPRHKNKEGKEIPSSWWGYVGLDRPAYGRYKKGVKGGGSKKIRANLHQFMKSQIQSGGAYEKIYREYKARLEGSDQLVMTNISKEGRKEIPWNDKRNGRHRDMAAMRYAIKIFLFDCWYVWRTLLGLETKPSYEEYKFGAKQEHIDLYSPKNRGWTIKRKNGRRIDPRLNYKDNDALI